MTDQSVNPSIVDFVFKFVISSLMSKVKGQRVSFLHARSLFNRHCIKCQIPIDRVAFCFLIKVGAKHAVDHGIF